MGPPLVVNPYGQVLDSGSVKTETQWAARRPRSLSETGHGIFRFGDGLIGVGGLLLGGLMSSSVWIRSGYDRGVSQSVELKPMRCEDSSITADGY